MQLTPDKTSAARTPFTVIGGFLGSGKTTLVNHLLRHARGRYAVLVNDFGAINVDATLVAAHDGETLRLANGCICCSLGDDFAASVAALLDAPEPFDHIFVEASGVSDPQAVADIAVIEPFLALDAVIIVADGERIVAQLADRRIGDTVGRQIHAADLILLNKCDLIDADILAATKDAIRSAKPGVRIVETVAAAVPMDLIADASAKPTSSRFRAAAASHEHQFGRLLFRRDAAFDARRLRVALDGLPDELLRLKGFCVVFDDPQLRLLQWVSGRWSLEMFGTAPARPMVELVGIGTANLDVDVVERIFDAALMR